MRSASFDILLVKAHDGLLTIGLNDKNIIPQCSLLSTCNTGSAEIVERSNNALNILTAFALYITRQFSKDILIAGVRTIQKIGKILLLSHAHPLEVGAVTYLRKQNKFMWINISNAT